MVSDDKLKEIIAQVVGEMMKDAPQLRLLKLQDLLLRRRLG
jgi:hypothetical protein